MAKSMDIHVLPSTNMNVSMKTISTNPSHHDINNMYSTYDRSNLQSIDADNNYWNDVNNVISSKYYNECNFNLHFKKNTNFSLIHMNIRSVPLHFSEFLSYLNTLDIEFSIIALSETAIHSNDIDYIIPNYNVEINT